MLEHKQLTTTSMIGTTSLSSVFSPEPVKGPVRDVMMRSGLWQRLGAHIHLDVDHAVESIARHQPRLEAAELSAPTSVAGSFGAVSA